MKIKIKNTTLRKISLAVSLIGILLLLFLSNILQPKLTNIGDINNKLINKKIKAQGQIFSIKTYEDKNFQVISIQDKTGKIDITSSKILNLTNSQTITIIGAIKEYKGHLQIQADKITIFRKES